MVFPRQNLLAWKISITIVHCLALSITMVRIRHRWRIGRIWWDDYLVGLPWVFVFLATVLMWVKFNGKDIPWYMPGAEGFIHSSWFETFIYLTIMWFSRISLTLSVARVFMPGHRYRIYTFIFAVVLFLMYLLSILVTLLSCPGSPWWDIDYSNCISTSNKAVTAIIVWITVDCSADIALVITPLLMFWKVKFPRPSDRITILALFAGNLLTIITAGILCAVWLSTMHTGPDSKLLFKMSADLHATLALVVTNLQIVSMMLYRKCRGSDSDPGDRRPDARPFDTDAGTATLQRRRSGIDDNEAVHYYPTTLPSYTIASLAPSRIPSSHPTSTSEPSSASVATTSNSSGSSGQSSGR